MLKGFQSNPCGRGLKLQILQTVGSLQLESSNSEVERIKGVKCLACQWEKGGFGIIPRGEEEEREFLHAVCGEEDGGNCVAVGRKNCFALQRETVKFRREEQIAGVL